MERPRFGVHFLVNTLLVMTLVPKCVALFVLAARKLIAGLWPFLISARHAVACSCSAALALASSSSLAHLSLVLISSVIFQLVLFLATSNSFRRRWGINNQEWL